MIPTNHLQMHVTFSTDTITYLISLLIIFGILVCNSDVLSGEMIFVTPRYIVMFSPVIYNEPVLKQSTYKLDE